MANIRLNRNLLTPCQSEDTLLLGPTTIYFKVQFGSLSGVGDSREPLVSDIIDRLFPFDSYRMLMSFVRTSELRAPIRVEFLEQGDARTWKDVLGIYLCCQSSL